MAEETGANAAGSVGAVETPGDGGNAAVAGSQGGDQTGETNSGTINVADLPEEMRGKTPAEISTMWGAAARVLADKNSETETQSARIAVLESAALERQQAPPEPIPDPDEGVDIKELMYEDPEKAVDVLLRRRYGETIDRLEAGIGQTAMIAARQNIGPDFDDHADAVKTILSKSSGPIDERAIQGAYYMARGLASVQADTAKAKLAIETPAPTPEVTEVDQAGPLTGLAAQIQRGSGLTEEEFIEFGEGELVVEVPGIKNA